jgi:DEAD/DEAH box helicase domain-containing protein
MASLRKITFDIETSNEFVGGDFNPLKLDLALVGIHDSLTDEYTSYVQEELPKLWPIIEKADLLIGYNSDHFDIPLLGKYYSGDLTTIKSIDLLKEVRAVLGRRLKLDSIAEATLGRKKIADGLQSIRWWKEGKIDEVRKYCLEDVRITKEIYDYARKNRKLKYMDYEGEREIKLDPSGWEKGADHALTHTLPF